MPTAPPAWKASTSPRTAQPKTSEAGAGIVAGPYSQMTYTAQTANGTFCTALRQLASSPALGAS